MMTKYLVVLLNTLMLLAGTLLSTMGMYGMNLGSEVKQLVSLSIPSWMTFLGVFLVLISIWGIYSAVNEDPVLLQTYLGALLLLVVAQFALSSLALARQADVDMMSYDAWDRAYHRDKDTLAKFEKTNSCCGFASLYDRAVPSDCTDNPEFGFIFPCHEKISDPVKSGLKTLGTTGIVLGLIEALGLVMSVILLSDFVSGYGERNAARFAQARHLLHEGNIAPQQYPQAGQKQ